MQIAAYCEQIRGRSNETREQRRKREKKEGEKKEKGNKIIIDDMSLAIKETENADWGVSRQEAALQVS